MRCGRTREFGRLRILLSEARRSVKHAIALRKSGKVDNWFVEISKMDTWGSFVRWLGSAAMMLFEMSSAVANGQSLLMSGRFSRPIAVIRTLSKGFCSSDCCEMRCLTDHPLLIAEPIPRKLRSFSSRATEVTTNAERAGKNNCLKRAFQAAANTSYHA